MEKAKDINEMLDLCPKNVIIRDNVIKAWHKSIAANIKRSFARSPEDLIAILCLILSGDVISTIR